MREFRSLFQWTFVEIHAKVRLTWGFLSKVQFKRERYFVEFSLWNKSSVKFRDKKRQFTAWIEKNMKTPKKGSSLPPSKVMLYLKSNDQYQ